MALHGFNHCRGGESRCYNRRAGQQGTLWESRYTSFIVQSSEYSSLTVSAQASAVEEEERALRTMSAYIDLNPVREAMVADHADYRWNGYAEAMAGKARSRCRLVQIVRPPLSPFTASPVPPPAKSKFFSVQASPHGRQRPTGTSKGNSPNGNSRSPKSLNEAS